MSVPFLLFTAALAMSAPLGHRPASASPAPSSNALDEPPTPAKVSRTVSVEGCVALESEIPGRKTTLGERTGLDRHFLLSRARMVKGTAPAAAADVTGEAARYAPLYKISGLTDEQVKIHVGRRVRIEGSFGSAAAAPAGTADTTGESDLADLNVATIRQVPGDCAPPKG